MNIKLQTLVLAVILMVIILAISACQADEPQDCPACTEDLQQDAVLPANTPLLQVPMKWCAMEDAPSIAEPDLVCEDNWKDVLWRRHERASECVFIPQCRITLRSASFAPKTDFALLADMNTTVGQPGDLIFSSTGFQPSDYNIEINERLLACHNNWIAQSKGILALSFGGFIGETGNPSAIRGVGIPSMTDPVLLVADPEFHPSGVDVEHVLAHEVGHVLGLCHVDDPSCNQAPNQGTNLMFSQGDNGSTELTENQCLIARNTPGSVFSNLAEYLDPQFLVDRLIDGINEADIQTQFAVADIDKLVLMDGTLLNRGLQAFIGTEGLIGSQSASYWLALDVDNDPLTGGETRELDSPLTQSGVELVFQLDAGPENQISRIQVLQWTGERFEIVQFDDAEVRAVANTVMMYTFTTDGDVEQPYFTEFEINVEPAALAQLGLLNADTSLFPNCLVIQAASRTTDEDGNELTDLAPDKQRALCFPRVEFPSVTVPQDRDFCEGDSLPIEVQGLTPNQPLKVFLGLNMFEPGITTDESGAASFEIEIPDATSTGPTLLTVGSTQVDNAVTAETTVNLCTDE